jgi:hypothetical protein
MRLAPILLAFAAQAASAAVPQTRMRTDYDVYAHGLRIAAFDASYGLGEGGYSIAVAYRTTGLAGAMFSGHQLSSAAGVWQAGGLAPLHADGDGYWRGEPRRIAIDYDDGDPVVRELTPPNEPEREPVPRAMQARTMDTLSAMMLLLHNVAAAGRCDADVTTFDGRRLIRITARTVGSEVLEATSRSSFAGPALRCDFEGVLLAGFLHDGHEADSRKPKHGSAWFASLAPDQPPAPVRITFETRWFGDATMYLTSAKAQPAP